MDITNSPRTITVMGHGKVTITPDEARIQAGVQATADTARDASATANQAMNAILTVLKDGGVAEQFIQTGFFSIRPEFEHHEGQQRRIGHTASNSVSVTIKAVASLGSLLDGVIDAGGDHVIVHNVNFAASEPVLAQAQDEARQAALMDARRQAELIAQTMGLTLGVVLTIHTNMSANFNDGSHAAKASYRAFNDMTPMQTGELNVIDSVSVIYAIAA